MRTTADEVTCQTILTKHGVATGVASNHHPFFVGQRPWIEVKDIVFWTSQLPSVPLGHYPLPYAPITAVYSNHDGKHSGRVLNPQHLFQSRITFAGGSDGQTGSFCSRLQTLYAGNLGANVCRLYLQYFSKTVVHLSAGYVGDPVKNRTKGTNTVL
jgi:hypothetical protein